MSKPPIENPEAEVEELPSGEDSREGLVSFLSEMTSVYHQDDKTVDVKLHHSMSAALDDNTVAINPSMPDSVDPEVKGPNILRVLDDILAHEVAHLNWSDLNGKKEFAKQYPGWSIIPGMVWNYIEDAYIDEQRKRIWYGMREKQAYRVWLVMQTDEIRPPVDEVEEEASYANALLEAFCQVTYAGYVKGLDDADDAIAEFAQFSKLLVDRARTEHDQSRRTLLAHAVMQLLIRYAPDMDEFEEQTAANGSTDGHGDTGSPRRAPSSPEPDVDMHPTAKKQLEEAIKKLMEDGEFPMPAPPESPTADSDSDSDAESGGSGQKSDDDGQQPQPDESASAAEPGETSDDEAEADESDEPASDDGVPTDAPDSDSDSSGKLRNVQSVLDKYKDRTLKVVN